MVIGMDLLKSYRREKSQALRNLPQDIGTFILDKILLDTDFLGGFEDRMPVGLPRTQGDTVPNIGSTAKVPLDPLGEVF